MCGGVRSVGVGVGALSINTRKLDVCVVTKPESKRNKSNYIKQLLLDIGFWENNNDVT